MNRILLALLPFLCLCCKDEGTPPPDQVSSIQLRLKDASCTEAWLQATTTETPTTVVLVRDNQRIQTLRLLTTDSLIIDEGLLPKRAYTYQLQKLSPDSNVIDATESLQVTTTDTTSHNFTWHMDTLGVSSSTLSDVAIINDTLAYAVGEMYLRDSTGEIDPILYNLAKWNGQRWHIQRVPVPLCPNGTGYFPLRTIFAFEPNDVWMTGGGEMIHWDGYTFQGDCSMNPLLQGGLNKIWGMNSSNLYAVGNAGTIIHRTGTMWRRVESGVTANMQDVWGYTDPNLGSPIVFSVGGTSGNVKLLTLSPTAARDTLSWPSMEDAISIWTTNGFAIYAAGVGIWRHRGSSWQRMGGLPSGILFTRVRGSSSNNIFAVGSFGTLVHWNGTSWRQYGELPTDFRYQGIVASQNLVVATGFTLRGAFGDKAAVVIGRRIQ